MFPYLFQLQNPSIIISNYGVMLAIAYLVGRKFYISRLNHILPSEKNPDYFILSLIIFSVIGAKLMFVFKNYELDTSLNQSSFLNVTGFSSQGAMLAALIVTILYSKLRNIKLNLLLDNAASPAILAYALARFGCFLAGDDCYGTISNLPWAMSFPEGISPTPQGHSVHPLPLYEIGYSLIILFYLLRLEKKNKPAYFSFFSLLLLWGVCRFLVEFISINPIKILAMTGSQFGALIMFLAAITFFSIHRLKAKVIKSTVSR